MYVDAAGFVLGVNVQLCLTLTMYTVAPSTLSNVLCLNSSPPSAFSHIQASRRTYITELLPSGSLGEKRYHSAEHFAHAFSDSSHTQSCLGVSDLCQVHRPPPPPNSAPLLPFPRPSGLDSCSQAGRLARGKHPPHMEGFGCSLSAREREGRREEWKDTVSVCVCVCVGSTFPSPVDTCLPASPVTFSLRTHPRVHRPNPLQHGSNLRPPHRQNVEHKQD